MATTGVFSAAARKGHGKSSTLVNSIAQLIDLSGSLTEIPAEDETEATLSDWEQVGEDLRAATRKTVEDLDDDTRALLKELVEA